MKYTYKICFLFLILTASRYCFAGEDTNNISVGPWSAPTESSAVGTSGSIQGRIVVTRGFSPGYTGKQPETLVYLELKNSSIGEAISLYFDPKRALDCQILDTRNAPPPPVGTGGNGGFPSACWITLPYDATIKLRASWYGHGMSENKGLMIPLFDPIIIEAGNTNDYFLSGSFTAISPTNSISPRRVWQGKLNFPPVKIWNGQRP